MATAPAPRVIPVTTSPTEAAAAEALAQVEAAKAVAPVDETPKPELVLGQKVLLTAVHGRIINPLTLVTMDVGKITKVEAVDSWDLIQYKAGKIKIAEV